MTNEEIEKLKKCWVDDPVWDIETTEGFESSYPELLKFRLLMEEIWRHRRHRRDAIHAQHWNQFLLETSGLRISVERAEERGEKDDTR